MHILHLHLLTNSTLAGFHPGVKFHTQIICRYVHKCKQSSCLAMVHVLITSFGNFIENQCFYQFSAQMVVRKFSQIRLFFGEMFNK
jgi:hypothetical protein